MTHRAFVTYGPSHWAVVTALLIGAALFVTLGRRQTESQARTLGRILGAVTAVLYAGILVYSSIPPSLTRSVPLQLTDLATMACAYALWTQRHWAVALTYYWGLVLSTQAVISPVYRGPDFPDYRFLAFFAIHVLVVWAAVYLTWGRGFRPTWRSYRFVVGVTVAWAVITFSFNSIAGSDYGFLNGKPDTPSLLDLFGPWPVYVFTAAALVAAVWALMTWPWRRSAGRLPS